MGYSATRRVYRHGFTHITRSFFSGFSACAGANVKQFFGRNETLGSSFRHRSYHIPVLLSLSARHVGILQNLFNNKCAARITYENKEIALLFKLKLKSRKIRAGLRF